MARSIEDIENYLIACNISYEQATPNTWLVHDPAWGGAQIVVHVNEPLVVFRVKLFEIPPNLADGPKARLFGWLLALNASDMLQGAYALEGKSVVAVEVMQLQNIDQNEFNAAIESLSQAIVNNRTELLDILNS